MFLARILLSKGQLTEYRVQLPCGINSPDGALPLFIGGGDRLGGEGVPNMLRMASLLTTHFHPHPLTSRAGPLPL